MAGFNSRKALAKNTFLVFMVPCLVFGASRRMEVGSEWFFYWSVGGFSCRFQCSMAAKKKIAADSRASKLRRQGIYLTECNLFIGGEQPSKRKLVRFDALLDS